MNLELSIKVHCVIYRLIRKIFRNQYAKKKKLSVTRTFSLKSIVIDLRRGGIGNGNGSASGLQRIRNA